MDAAVGVDQEGVGHAREDAVGGADLPVGIEHDREEIEAVRSAAASAPTSVRPEISTPISVGRWPSGSVGQGLLQEGEQLVAVRARVQEEDQDHRLAAVRGEIEGLVRVEDRARKAGSERQRAEDGLDGVAARRQAHRLAQLRLDRGLRLGLVDGELAEPEGDVALGVGAEERDGHAHAELLRDRGARVVDDREVESGLLRECGGARAARPVAMPYDLEVVLGRERRDRRDCARARLPPRAPPD